MASLSVQLAVLAELEDPLRGSQIGERLGVEEFEVEEAVSDLEAAGLVEREGFGAKTRLVPTTPELARLASSVRSSLPTAGWQALFGAERVQLVHVVDEVGRLEVAAEVLDEPVEAVEDAVYRLLELGVLEGPQTYGVADEHGDLRELLAEIDELRARGFVRELDVGAEILWHLGPEILFSSGAEVSDPTVTYGGPTLFEEWTGQNLADRVYHHRTLRDLDASDAILQTLLALGSGEDVIQHCLELYASEATPTFREKAQIYGLEDVADRIVQAGSGEPG